MKDKPSNEYLLPQSDFYPNKYPPMTIDFDHVKAIRRYDNHIRVEKIVGYMNVAYSDEFATELLLRDILNKWEEYKEYKQLEGQSQ